MIEFAPIANQMRVMLIDSHCHLNYPGLVEDEAGVVARAKAAGIGAMISISTREREWAEVIAGAERHADVYATVGIHPHEADAHPAIDTQRLVEASRHPRVVGIGETGLDYFYDKSDRDRQRRSFRSHIAASRETGLPLIVHTRDAEDDTIAILDEDNRELAVHRIPYGAYVMFDDGHIVPALLQGKAAEVIAENAGAQFGTFKPKLADLAVSVMAPITTEMNRLMQDPAEIDRILGEGASRAEAIARPILDQVYDIVGMIRKAR